MILDEQGLTYNIPIAWTDYAVPDPCVQLGQGRVRLRADDLLRLLELIDQWRRSVGD